ncbi:carbon monoxide-induced hydrogenase [Reticulibacter mediterranei]|uniref:Carbon monoxide-induced hydrogenase n=2 Tax=Reticulibacter mediterranei TaxID=2778369 RepID=A0A8J3N7F9_9CHLR|nr:carbon monoxide-induced hydrogenase [Reticulibacter mediterranei]
MATELAVLSLGPLQPFTAGPLRLFLVCDGEQVCSVQMETGYAHRNIGQAMTLVDWQQGLILARHFDPLAPIAGQLVYVRALEQLQGWQASVQIEQSREMALALERVHNVLWWLVRFARILGEMVLQHRSSQIARNVMEVISLFWREAPEKWLLPQRGATALVNSQQRATELRRVSDDTDALLRYVERNRAMMLRTRGIGRLSGEQLKQCGVISGPVLSASEHDGGDVHSRLVARLSMALHDLRSVAEMVTLHTTDTSVHPAVWEVPPGETSSVVDGPRGSITVRLIHQGAKEHDGPTQILWRGPSAPLVALLPELLAGQKLADAQVILASLDLAMAEVDG